MKIFGIDPGSIKTGFACIELPQNKFRNFKEIKIIDIGVIHGSKSDSINHRIGEMHNSVIDLLAQHKPDSFVLEKCFFGVNPQSSLKLGMARGAFICAAFRAGIQISEISPNEVKKNIAGHGHAEKIDVQRILERLLSVTLSSLPFDASDALAIAVSSAMLNSFVMPVPFAMPAQAGMTLS